MLRKLYKISGVKPIDAPRYKEISVKEVHKMAKT